MDDFLAMGGYATYVWSSYAIFVVGLLIDFLAPRWRNGRIITELPGRLARQKKKTETAT